MKKSHLRSRPRDTRQVGDRVTLVKTLVILVRGFRARALCRQQALCNRHHMENPTVICIHLERFHRHYTGNTPYSTGNIREPPLSNVSVAPVSSCAAGSIAKYQTISPATYKHEARTVGRAHSPRISPASSALQSDARSWSRDKWMREWLWW